jgi:putative DNA primase/helicase
MTERTAEIGVIVPVETDGVTTDAANATRLHAIAGDFLRFVERWNAWLVWDGTRWVHDERKARAAELAKEVGREILAEGAEGPTNKRLLRWGAQSLMGGRMNAMLEAARGLPGILLDHELLDADPWLLGVRNGVIDLRSGACLVARPEHLMMMRANVRYDPAAACPRFERAMEEWFPDPETREYVQRLTGAALVGEQRDHVFVVHYGSGANGKGTYMRALAHLLGPYMVTPHMGLLVHQRSNEHDTIKAQLFRARLAVASETSRRVSLDEASVKNLTGRDRITCRRLYENPWEFEPTHTLWLQTNFLPRISGRDHGIWRRIRVVPWTETFANGSDEDLDATLCDEAPGILAWAVRGCLAWQERGLDEPEAVVRATFAYRSAEDHLARFQADVGLLFGGGLVAVSALNSAFTTWCAEQGIKARMDELREWLADNGAEPDRDHVAGQRVRVWRGVHLADQMLQPTTVQTAAWDDDDRGYLGDEEA